MIKRNPKSQSADSEPERLVMKIFAINEGMESTETVNNKVERTSESSVFSLVKQYFTLFELLQHFYCSSNHASMEIDDEFNMSDHSEDESENHNTDKDPNYSDLASSEESSSDDEELEPEVAENCSQCHFTIMFKSLI